MTTYVIARTVTYKMRFNWQVNNPFFLAKGEYTIFLIDENNFLF